MRTAHRLTAVFALSLLCASCAPRAEEEPRQVDQTPTQLEPRWPQSPDELGVNLTVSEALEGGPVVCTVTLTNVSKVPLKYATDAWNKGAYCAGDACWKVRGMALWEMYGSFDGNPGPYTNRLNPGETASETFYLHAGYLGIPPGEAHLQFGWRVYKIVEKSSEHEWDRNQLDLLFELRQTQTVLVLPASSKNVRALLNRLQGRFDAIIREMYQRPDNQWRSADAARSFISTITGCRDREFVPLLVRSVDELSDFDYGPLVEAVYESHASSQEGFAALAIYLSSSNPASAEALFNYWAAQDWEYRLLDWRLEELSKPQPPETDPKKLRDHELWREGIQQEVDAWHNSKRHLDTRLTPDQFAQLRAMKDVWVRTLLYSYYPDHCPPDWVEALFSELKDLQRPPQRLRDLIARLDDDDFDVREQATAELIQSGPAFAPYLWAAPLDKLPAETASRLRQVRDKVGKPELSRLCQRTIAHLGSYGEQPQNRKLLDALRAGDCPSLVSQTAQQAFDENQKRQEEEAAREKRREKN